MSSLLPLYRNPAARGLLVCFPPAGAVGAVYSSWARQLPAEWELCSMSRSQGIDHFAQLIPVLAEALLSQVRERGIPVALFGHSLGALVAFGLARQLRAAQAPALLCLLVASANAPHLPLPEVGRREKAWSEDELVSLLQKSGTHPAILGNRAVLQKVLQRLQRDLGLRDSARFPKEPPLPCPIAVFGGRQDQEVPLADLVAWEQQTSSHFSLHLFPGNHFFLNDDQALPLFLRALVFELGKWLPACSLTEEDL